MLNQVADGVWVRQSEWVLSNAVVVRGEDGLILVDPGIDGFDLNQLADELDRLGIPVVAGFSTHPHWDHLLWHPRFGDLPSYATAACASAAGQARERGQKMAAESASGIPLELLGLVTPLPADGGPVAGEILEHRAHAIGHAAVLLADRSVLLAGDMLSDVLIPILDRRRPGQVDAYEAALDRLSEAAGHVDVLVPGHGAVARGPEVAARICSLIRSSSAASAAGAALPSPLCAAVGLRKKRRSTAASSPSGRVCNAANPRGTGGVGRAARFCRMRVRVASRKSWPDIADQRLCVFGRRVLIAATTVPTVCP
jgi:glyoxylase-like metal-dependent hydrolase (beta-lactamase superfamily II)